MWSRGAFPIFKGFIYSQPSFYSSTTYLNEGHINLHTSRKAISSFFQRNLLLNSKDHSFHFKKYEKIGHNTSLFAKGKNELLFKRHDSSLLNMHPITIKILFGAIITAGYVSTYELWLLLSFDKNPITIISEIIFFIQLYFLFLSQYTYLLTNISFLIKHIISMLHGDNVGLFPNASGLLLI